MDMTATDSVNSHRWYESPRLNLHQAGSPNLGGQSMSSGILDPNQSTSGILNSEVRQNSLGIDGVHGEMSSAVVEHMNNFFAHHHGGLSSGDSQGHRAAAAARYYHQSMHTPYAAASHDSCRLVYLPSHRLRKQSFVPNEIARFPTDRVTRRVTKAKTLLVISTLKNRVRIIFSLSFLDEAVNLTVQEDDEEEEAGN
ncbi:hypothetical protein RUM43_008059 [Polyplax serrata]|uniref:Uncharacterized protein n=1 Tax=Polyplax serrata TaxID=468196 RepID=A0AAN8S8V9_POLSC